MKKGILFSLFVLTFLSVSFGQTTQYKSGLSFKVLALDYQTFNAPDGSFTNFSDYRVGFEVGYHRLITNRLGVNIPLKAGVVQSHENIAWLEKTIIGADAKLNYFLTSEESSVRPYLLGGVGGVGEIDGKFNLQVPVGLGFNFRLNEKARLNFQGEYRNSFSDDRDNLQYGLGFVWLLGKGETKKKKEEPKIGEGMDSDGDGLMDDIDLCPQQAGSRELSGCPDGDGDGLADYEDKCPNDPGPIESRGCPDSDGDGLSDFMDECPNMKGTIENNGCPTNKDTDGDGLFDSVDDCPLQAGTLKNRGCPEERDSDGDGVNDSQDECPTIPGTAANKGCPGSADADNDGILDNVDRCPNTYGTLSANGCPDADGDGIADLDDQCPNVAGLSIYNGCADSDGDGIHDGRDQCPNTYGDVANNGCPNTTRPPTPPRTTTVPTTTVPSTSTGYSYSDIETDDIKTLEAATRAIQFESARAVLKERSLGIMNQVADIALKYPNYVLSIVGHTDSQGDAGRNLVLSEERAKSCYEYLATRGVPLSRMSYSGYGESDPVADNNTAAGRKLNRRVQFILIPR